jgi:uncharacterized protein
MSNSDFKRSQFIEKIDFQFRIHSVVGLLGPRQVGKTTLARHYAQKFKNVTIFDLENLRDLARLKKPMLALADLDSDLVIIDEIQMRPDLFPTLRVLVDQRPRKFLILGSASRDLLQQSSETLAGRIGYIELTPFSLSEVHDSQKLWVRGGFPLSYLAESEEESFSWRQEYIATYMERDMPALGFNIPPLHVRRLWMMLAHNHGNILNLTDIGNSLDISHHTVRRYTDILAGTFMVRLLEPWFENISKRQVKAPKVYIRDSGLLWTLLDIRNLRAAQVYSRLGAAWEGFALEELIKHYEARPEECFFWATQSGAELDLLIMKDGKRLGFEIKYTDSPSITKSMHIAMEDLKLDHLYVVYPYHINYPMAENITALGFENLSNL